MRGALLSVSDTHDQPCEVAESSGCTSDLVVAVVGAEVAVVAVVVMTSAVPITIAALDDVDDSLPATGFVRAWEGFSANETPATPAESFEQVLQGYKQGGFGLVHLAAQLEATLSPQH